MDFKTKRIIIIGGVHKAATTSLYEYFIAHQAVCAGKKKEIHYYTPLRYGREPAEFSEYQQQFSSCAEKAYFIDASPSYLYGKEKIAKRIKDDLENVMVIFILRNPVERFISFYRFLKAGYRLDKNETLLGFISKSYGLRNMEERDDVYYRAYREGCYSDYLKDWIYIYGDSVKIIFFDDLKKNPIQTMKELANWIGMDGAVFDDRRIYGITNKTQPSKSKYLYKMAMSVNMTFENFWRKNKKFKGYLKQLYFKVNGSENKEIIKDSEIMLLAELYKQKNTELYELLAGNNYKVFPRWITDDVDVGSE